MILIAVNYKWELLNPNSLWKIEKEIKYFNEPKWSVFALKLQQHLLQNPNKYSFVLHFGSCWWISSNLWNIYKIDRSFLYYLDIIENQRFCRWEYKFESIENSNIVTKFALWKHDKKLYDFANLYDLETFWVAQLSNTINIPIISIKWVTDNNEFYNKSESKEKEIDNLLNFWSKENIILNKEFEHNLILINENFERFYNWEFFEFYNKILTNKEFKKKYIHGISIASQ